VAILCFAILFVVHESINKRLFTVSQYLHNYDPQYPSSPLTLKSNRLITRDGDELYQLGDETNKITTRLTLLYNHIKYEQERFSDFANVASDWLWESNSEGVLIFASNEMKQALNIDSEQSLHFKDIPMLKNATNLLAKLEEKHSFSFCQETVVMNDISHYLLFHAIANYQHDRFIGYRGTAIDITVLQQVQIELEELNNTLEKKVADRTSDLEMSMIQLKETQQQLIESAKLAALGGLVSGVAHEVNTPLGISVTATSIIKEIATEFNQSFANQTLTTDQFSQLMSRMDASITMLESNLNRGAKLIRDFKQTAVDQVSESRCEFSVHQVLEALITSLHTETRKVPVKPKVLGNTELMMNSLPGVLTQVFTNLILNSVNHAFSDPDQTEKHPPEITISFRQEGELLHFDYHDNGSGIDHMLHQKIFEPFYTSKRGKGGSGLGLNLVFNLIHQKLQGQLIFDSALGEGVHFAFHLPIKLPLSEQEITD
jgi:signal transduction histidine kinase